MDTADSVKRLQRSCRGRVDRILTEVKELLNAEEIDKRAIGVKGELLDKAFTELEDADWKVKEKMYEDGASKEEEDQEDAEVDKYREYYYTTKTEIAQLCSNVSQKEESTDIMSVSSESKKRKFKLPEFKLQSFGGDLKEWMGWWSQFKKIHEAQDVDPTDKFEYLAGALTPHSEAKRIVDGYPRTEANYEKAVEALVEAFGRPELQLQVYVRELLKLVIANASKDKKLPLDHFHVALETHLNALSELEMDKADPLTLLYPLVESGVPEDTLRAWQRSSLYKIDGATLDPPKSKLDLLRDFIKTEVRAERQIALAQQGFQSRKEATVAVKRRPAGSPAQKFDQMLPTVAGLYTGQPPACVFCEGKHFSSTCGKALSLSRSEINKILKAKRLCFRCIRGGHSIKACKTKLSCRFCGGNHADIMCSTKRNEAESSDASNDRREEASGNKRRKVETVGNDKTGSVKVFLQNCSQGPPGTVLMNTVKIYLRGKDGSLKTYRLEGDSASQRSYVRTNAVENVDTRVVDTEWLQNIVFGAVVTQPRGYPRHEVTIIGLNGEERTLELLEREEVTGNIYEVPDGPWIQECLDRGIVINDIGDGSSPPDILIGNDYWGALRTGKLVHLPCGLTAEETVFGWTIGGPLPKQVNSSYCTAITVPIQETISVPAQNVEQLWKLEAIGIRDPAELKSAQEEEQEALSVFSETTIRDHDGRYVVALPWRAGNSNLPTNRQVAEARLKSATYKLKQIQKLDDYHRVFQDWEKEGLIARVPDDLQSGYHVLPHRPVFKDSSTTPCRPVYDASSKQGRDPSLNDCLFKGPNLIELIPVMLLRLCEKKVGCSADIRKAFQNIGVRQVDQLFQRFLWWEDTTCKIMVVYQHLRVVFGMTCSPFLLGAIIKFHLKKYDGDAVAEKLQNGFYVDNLVASMDSLEEYQNFRERSIQIMSEAKMELRQWECSGKPSEEPVMSMLGVNWDTMNDTLGCVIKDFVFDGAITKRGMLSVIAQVFDPMGWLCPALLIPKLLVQESWTQQCGWDEPVSQDIELRFRKWMAEIHVLKKIRVPRFSQLGPGAKHEIHIFADGSTVGMAAVAFLRTELEDERRLQFLIAKSRLTPVKKLSIPRAELVACVLAIRLAKTLTEAWGRRLPFVFWTDSTTALAWIRRNGDWGVFVRNRVAEILLNSTEDMWHHVPGQYNPADLPSRGCEPSALLKSRWHKGPSWLMESVRGFEENELILDEAEVTRELKKSAVLWTEHVPCNPPLSTYRKNVGIWAWVKRFCTHSSERSFEKGSGLSKEELLEAEKYILKKIQSEAFAPDVTEIGGIRVFRDQMGLLRVKSRLTHREDTEDFKYPIVLPKAHPLVDMLIRDIHVYHGHGGIHFLLSKIREKYWIIQSRRAVRRVLRTCMRCKRHTAKSLEVEQACLPGSRVKDSECFATTGVDCLGPLYLRNDQKAWVVLYTCAVYRAVELDVVTSMSAEAFVGSLERFVSKCGRPNTLYSDNGTNFTKAAALMNQTDWEKVQKLCDLKQIRWVFNPPTASWWGGFWERMVRSVKDLLKRMLGRSKLSYDELRTCLAGVTATINDRPLTAITEDSDDLIPLTPAVFLRPRVSGQFPELGTCKQLSSSYRKMKEHQARLQARFRKEYLSLLISRSRKKDSGKLEIGDVVLVGADNKKRYDWPLGLVMDFLPSRDNKKRVARVKTASGVLSRPVQHLYPLEVSRPKQELALEEASEIPVAQTSENASEPTVTVTRSGRRVKAPIRYAMWNQVIRVAKK